MKKEIVFGTDGIRGNAEEFPFTQQALQVLGKAIGKWAKKKYRKNNPSVLIGYDTRISGDRIKNALVDGLKIFSVHTFDGGVIPTPSIYQIISKDNTFDLGIVISASHNIFCDNGIKLFDSKRCKLSAQDEAEISDLFSVIAMNGFEAKQCVETIGIKLYKSTYTYQENIKTFFKENFLAGVRVVLDCANGATYVVAPEIFKSLGAEVITLSNQPTGENINDNCGALYLDNIKRAVITHKADIGFAFDGDGDRVIAVNKGGIVKDGDDLLFLLSHLPLYKDSLNIVGTVMSNSGFEQSLKNSGKNLVRTAVGDKNVVVKMEEFDCLLGGEASGHIILKDYLSTGDGIFVALRVLESILLTKNWDMKTFEKMSQVLLNVSVEKKDDLSKNPYAEIILKHEQCLKQGRLLVRFSGTEKLLRVMVEAESLQIARTVAQSLASKLTNELMTNFSSYASHGVQI